MNLQEATEAIDELAIAAAKARLKTLHTAWDMNDMRATIATMMIRKRAAEEWFRARSREAADARSVLSMPVSARVYRAEAIDIRRADGKHLSEDDDPVDALDYIDGEHARREAQE